MAKAEAKKIPALLIKSKAKEGFRRCGFAFTPEGIHITEADALAAGLTEDQIETLRNEPMLVVQETEIGALEQAAE